MQKKIRLIDIGFTTILFLGSSISVSAAELSVTVQSDTLETTAKLPILFYQKQQNIRKNGKIRYKWVRVDRQKVDDNGSIKFQFPENIGEINAKGAKPLNAFKLIRNIKAPKSKLSSSVFSNKKTSITFDLDVIPSSPPPSLIDNAFIKKTSQATLHKLNRITFGVTPELLERVNTIGIKAYIEEQLNPETIDDSEVLANVDGWIEAPDAFNREKHLAYYTLYHAIYSKRQLQEVMTQFWENHFNTDVSKTSSYIDEAKENSLFRANALGKFRDILAISAHSPMMLKYLDNGSSKKQQPNENYAREIMELHTLGISGGYTEEDVVELAKILTGWSYQGTKGEKIFNFRVHQHDESDKVFLGQPIESNGQEEGELVLDILASSPMTAKFLCVKLAQVFVNDQPSDKTVKNCSNVFRKTEGDMRKVVGSLLKSKEFRIATTFHSKVKTPLEFVVGLNRAFNFKNPQPSGSQTLKSDINLTMTNAMKSLNMALYRMPAPTGYAETAEKWVNSAQLKARMRYQNKLILNQKFNMLAEIKALGLDNAEDVVDYLLVLLLGNDFQPEEREIALNVLTENHEQIFDVNAIDETNLRNKEMDLLRMTIATIASFPSHQLQ
ncbi:MAG: DUF1800 domain-containing protein [Methylococcales bacterium]|nr:DUF1800 domain-containing protein [Methylococcales bacterium]